MTLEESAELEAWWRGVKGRIDGAGDILAAAKDMRDELRCLYTARRAGACLAAETNIRRCAPCEAARAFDAAVKGEYGSKD